MNILDKVNPAHLNFPGVRVVNKITCRHCGTPAPSAASDDSCSACGKKFWDAGLPAEPTAGMDDVTLAPEMTVPAESTHSSLAGTDFGDYELIREIARGGMGVVFKARQKNLDRIVALKMILEGQFASQLEVDRFKIEAQAAAHLDHPGIVPVYDQGVVDGRHFFSMALVEGESLSAKLSNGPLPGKSAAEMLLKIASGVEYAHQRGIVHRDLKPANILIDASGEPRITDFGLAKRPDQKTGLTMTGQMLGTPSYMAPEQATGRDEITSKTDIYALGAILYAMLTGNPPFQGTTLMATISEVMEKEPVPPTRFNASIDLDLETICLKCLEKDPMERYASADMLIAELQRFLNGEPIEARPLSGFGKLRRWQRIIARNKDVRIRSNRTFFGVPMVDIAFGQDRDANEEIGSAKGIVAIGDRATGIFAYGKFARGVFAMGMYSIGILSFGMFSAGVISIGMISLGVIYGTGGLAVGYYSFGFVAIGVYSIGVIAIGAYSSGWKAIGALGMTAFKRFI